MSAHLAPRAVEIPALVPRARGPLRLTLRGVYDPGTTGAETAFTLAQARHADTGAPYTYRVDTDEIAAAVRSYEQQESHRRAPREDVEIYLQRVRAARGGERG